MERNKENILKERFTKEEYLKRLSDVNKSLLIFKDDNFTINELILRKKELEIILDYFDSKEIKLYKCKVCKREFELNEENKYIVSTTNIFLSEKTKSESFDCPYCGCQNIVNSYHEIIHE